MARMRMAWMLNRDRGRDMVEGRGCDGVVFNGAVVSSPSGVLRGVSPGGEGANHGSDDGLARRPKSAWWEKAFTTRAED